jgi:fimbrial chaperone protein
VGWIVGAALSGAVPARSADFQVKPIQVTLSSAVTSALLTVSNNESAPISFQLSSFTWTENPQGAIALAETDDLIFFPQIFTVAAGEQRKVRVGVTSGVIGSEKAYRLLLAQLPAVETKDHPATTGVQVLTEVSVPIFIQPPQEARAGAIDSMTIINRNLSFQVRNSGNVHFTIESVTLSGLSAAGTPAFSRSEKGWYVLAGDNRSYSIPLSASECGNASAIEVSIKTEDYTLDKSLIQRLPISAQSCDAPPRPRITSMVGANPISSN